MEKMVIGIIVAAALLILVRRVFLFFVKGPLPGCSCSSETRCLGSCQCPGDKKVSKGVDKRSGRLADSVQNGGHCE